jgi:hypothetical protein
MTRGGPVSDETANCMALRSGTVSEKLPARCLSRGLLRERPSARVSRLGPMRGAAMISMSDDLPAWAGVQKKKLRSRGTELSDFRVERVPNVRKENRLAEGYGSYGSREAACSVTAISVRSAKMEALRAFSHRATAARYGTQRGPKPQRPAQPPYIECRGAHEPRPIFIFPVN